MDSDDSYLDEYDYYNEDEDDEDDVRPPLGTLSGLHPPPASLLPHDYNLPRIRYITPEEADRNARELLQEEEREKEKADKKRLRKKRQKDRRRQKQQDKSQSEERTATPDNHHINGEPKVEAGEEEEDQVRPSDSQSASDDDLDLRSTFVRQAQRKVETKGERRGKEARPERASDEPQERAQRPQPNNNTAPPPTAPREHINILDRFKIQESFDLANMGNNMAARGRCEEALHYYTEAIRINPSETRFLGNRSYVYERLGRYEEAVRDADFALQIEPNFLKGHFRKGKALKGLQRYAEAAASFQQVLSCDLNHAEAAAEIVQCQQKIQEAMTSTRVKILSSAPLSPPATPPSGVSGQNNKVFVPRNIYNTKCDPNRGSAPKREPGVTPRSKFYPIWVGNVTNKITENILRQKFQPFGLVHSVRILYARTCAFINFTCKDSAEAAFSALQGANVEGTTLVLQLRNPEHSVQPGR